MHLLVVGTPRSGTTLLTCLIGAHPNCIMMGECFSAEEHKIVSPAKVIGNKLCSPNQVQFSHPPPRVSLRRLPHRILRRLVALIPGYSYRDLPLGRLSVQRYVQDRDARLLFIVRTPGQVVESMRRRDGCDVEEAISRWARGMREMHRAIDAFGDRSHVTQFESLVEFPERVMQNVSEFLGLEYAPTMLEGYENTPQYERGRIDPEVAKGSPETHRIEERVPKAVRRYRALCERAP